MKVLALGAMGGGKSLFFLVIDPALIGAAIVVLCFGPSTRGRPLLETSLSH